MVAGPEGMGRGQKQDGCKDAGKAKAEGQTEGAEGD